MTRCVVVCHINFEIKNKRLVRERLFTAATTEVRTGTCLFCFAVFRRKLGEIGLRTSFFAALNSYEAELVS